MESDADCAAEILDGSSGDSPPSGEERVREICWSLEVKMVCGWASSCLYFVRYGLDEWGGEGDTRYQPVGERVAGM